MSDSFASVTQWIEDVRQGDDSAAQALWNRYFQRLVALARAKLAGSPTRAEDEEDVALCALNSFFQSVQQGRYPQLRDRHGLWPLLARITEFKAVNLRQKVRAKKRGGGFVRGDSAFQVGGLEELVGGIENAAVAGPSDGFAESLNLMCRELMEQLGGDESLVQIARLKLEGYTNAEIATRIGRVPRTVERKLDLIRTLWSKAGGLE
jgi:DNA-directed RNA polymerase specialized sigma24 family protein